MLFVLVLAICAVGNLPWHLDNYDQAKQAYISYEIARGGSWWYQHTPQGDTATKPPLAGWLSLPFRWITGSWDLAWRLPGYLCTLVILLILSREARRILPDFGVLLVVCAFGLNLLTPRIATLVRTDMMLTLWITICGWLIYRKIDSGLPWTTSERWGFFSAMLAALMTKGPILYAFVLPGMAAFWFLGPKDRRSLVWSGWWTWLLPLVLFAVWLVIGCLTKPEFYNDVVIREFMSRFDQSLKAHEKQQPIWFYFPHLLHKFAPWSLLALALPIASENVRRRIKTDPGTLWLACWALGGLLCMTLIPSKRVDRIFPVIPPLCLLLVSMVSACQCGKRVRAWCGARRRLRCRGGLRLFLNDHLHRLSQRRRCIGALRTPGPDAREGGWRPQHQHGRGTGRTHGDLLRCRQLCSHQARDARIHQWRAAMRLCFPNAASRIRAPCLLPLSTPVRSPSTARVDICSSCGPKTMPSQAVP